MGGQNMWRATIFACAAFGWFGCDGGSGGVNPEDAGAQKEAALGFWSAVIREGDGAKAKSFSDHEGADQLDGFLVAFGKRGDPGALAAADPGVVVMVGPEDPDARAGQIATFMTRVDGAWKVDVPKTLKAMGYTVEALAQVQESAAISALRTLVTVQSLFRDTDKDGDGNANFGKTLSDLAKKEYGGLLDETMASGTKQGYKFEMVGSDWEWSAVATPLDPNGRRSFFADESGVIRYEKPGATKRPSAESNPLGD